MYFSLFSQLTILLLLGRLVSTLGIDDQVNADIDYGTFQDPSSQVRPKFRYWVPDASIDPQTIANDIAAAGQAGAGGVELLGYYFYGELPGDQRYSPVLVDWTKYGWGTPAWKAIQDSALKAARDNGLVLDLAIGPNQGAGVPAPVDADSLQYNIVPFNISIAAGQSYNSTLPGWGTGALVAATTAEIVSVGNSSSPQPSLPGDPNANRTQIVLSLSSLTDVSNLVNEDGSISVSISANATSSDEGGLLFAFYKVHTEYREQEPPGPLNIFSPQSPVTSYVENGSFVVGHFSTAGAQAVIGFWEEHLIDNSTRELLAEVGNYGWEDSQEFGTATYVVWTSDLPSHFQQHRGYSMTEFLPIFFHNNNGFQGSQSSTWYVTDETGGGESHVADYRQTLLELNMLYLDALRNWTNSLGFQMSAQVGYNIPEDMLAIIPSLNAPECESLDFSSNIDNYRQYSGPANLAGKRVVSSECGAVPLSAYQLMIPHLLWDVKRSIAGSINQFVFHGLPYSGWYPNTTWPGFTTFDYSYSEMHGPRQPAWDHYPDWLNYVGRTTYVAQSGVPKFDIAFWLKQTQFVAHEFNSQYMPGDLEEAGYTYSYLSPDNFDLSDAYVANGSLAPKSQAFQAMVIRSNQSLTTSGVSKLVEFANAGLPVLFSGGVPTKFLDSSSAAGQISEAEASLQSLLSKPNVQVVPSDNLASTLTGMGIHPRVSVSANMTWRTYWREDERTTTSYVYVYNDATSYPRGQGSSTGSITVHNSGQPYSYDAWTGEISPIYKYNTTGGATTIPLQLAGNQTTIIGFQHGAASSNSSFTANNKIPSHAWTTISTKPGHAIIKVPSTECSWTLSNWTVTIESWALPTDPYVPNAGPQKTNTTYAINELIPWNAIAPELKNVSGLGYYSTSFSWPPPATSDNTTAPQGAMLDIGPIVHTARATLNSHALPPLDVAWAMTDIGNYLLAGENKLEIVVSSPLGNGLIPYWGMIQTSGKMPPGNRTTQIAAPKVADYGLVGEVVVRPYIEFEVQAVV